MKRFDLFAAGFALCAAALALSACNAEPASDATDAASDAATTSQPDDAPAASSAPAGADSTTHAHADWAGKWIGQEGLYADITPTEPGRYQLKLQLDLDGDGTYVGRDAEGGIAFEKDGETKLLRKGTADEINLKWVDGDDCLMVEEFVGFCRE